jgi:hypothetical protein
MGLIECMVPVMHFKRPAKTWKLMMKYKAVEKISERRCVGQRQENDEESAYSPLKSRPNKENRAYLNN